jgi:SAM-dependent methyltransferase
MVRIAEKKLRAALTRELSKGFERLSLEGPGGEVWTIEAAEHPTTRAPVLVARGEDRQDVHDLAQLHELLLKLSRQGFVKHSYFLPGGRRLRLDARYGKVSEKQAELSSRPGTDPIRADNAFALLQAIGIMKSNGQISAKEAKKLKQINDFARVAEDVLGRIIRRPKGSGHDGVLRIVDAGCGNSYLSFVIAFLLRQSAQSFKLLGIDGRAELIERSRARSEVLGFAEFMEFRCGRIEDQEIEGELDLVMALHACDTASDEALELGLRGDAQAVLLVPCCQNEIFLQLGEGESWPALGRYSLYRREAAAALTDSLRGLVLEAFGYKVRVLEFTAALHTNKSLMIRAEKAHRPQIEARRAFEEACESYRAYA